VCTKLVSFTRLYRDARSTEHKKYRVLVDKAGGEELLGSPRPGVTV
jgi:hypothetical protein